jgi:hypothetical protein
MKKKLLYSSLLAFALVGFSACDSFLDENPKDQMPEEEAYKSPELIYLNTVANLYTQIGSSDGGNGLGGTDRGLYDIQTFTADEAILPIRGGDWEDGGLWKRLYQHKWDKSEAPFKSTWDYLYRVIGLANQSIDKLSSLMENDPENIYLPVYKAEVQAIRALYYYYLMDCFGRVPIVDKSDIQISDVKQSERSEVFDFVRKELQEAAPLLSTSNSTKEGEYYGRMTRPVAYFLLAKLALNAQVYSDNDWTDNNGAPNGSTDFEMDGQQVLCWDAVIAYADLITDLGYSLASDYSANFSVGNESSPENIFTIPMDPTKYSAQFYYIIRTVHYTHGSAYSIDGWNGASATKDLLTAFRKSKNDPRLELCFYTGKVNGPDGQPVMDGDVELEYKPDAIAVDVSGATEEKTAGARWKKYAIDPSAQQAGKLQSIDYVLFRYADVLLMKAEAKLRKGQYGDAEINAVRGRVGANDLAAASLNELLDERARELSWEGVRRQDLVRFGKYTTGVTTDGRESAPYRNVFPIPHDVVLLNKNLTQNKGYE